MFHVKVSILISLLWPLSFNSIIIIFGRPATTLAHSPYECQFTNDGVGVGDGGGGSRVNRDNVSFNENLEDSSSSSTSALLAESRQNTTSRTCETICPQLRFKGNCFCKLLPQIRIGGDQRLRSDAIRLECSHTNASILMSDIEILSQCPVQMNLIELYVKDSNLSHLYHLPSGLYNILELGLDNTGIDLETIRESQELLKSLEVLRISNEYFTEIPETFFNGMEELKKLSLNRLGMAYINVDAFLPLQDSLKLLEMRSNRLTTIPAAIQILSHLECLDLSGNHIQSVSDGNTVAFRKGLKRLKFLRINTINCSCEFGKSEFTTWLRSHAIKGVQCSKPERLMEKDVSNTPIEEFCETWPGNGDNRFITTADVVTVNRMFIIIINILIFKLFL